MRDSRTNKAQNHGFTLTEVMTATFVLLIVTAAVMEFFISTSVTLESAQTELAAAQENRVAALYLKTDARNADYLLAFEDIAAMRDAANEDGIARGSRGNIALFITNDDSAFESVVAYYPVTDLDGNTSLQRVFADKDELGSTETISQMVARVIDSSLVEPRLITDRFEGNLNGDIFYLHQHDSVVLSGSITEGHGTSEFSKTINLTLNVSRT